MLVLDELLLATDEEAICAVTPTANSPWAESGKMECLAVVEWMAQAVGAYVGALRRRRGLPAQPGFFVESRKMSLYQEQVTFGRRYLVWAQPIWMQGASGRFRCRVTEPLAETIVAEGSILVHEPKK